MDADGDLDLWIGSRLEAIDAQLDAMREEGEQYEEYDRTSNGWVWFYRQLPADSTATVEVDTK